MLRVLPLAAQGSMDRVDSLRAILPDEAGPERAHLLNEISELIISNKPNESLAKAREALRLGKQYQLADVIATARYNIASYHYLQGGIDSADVYIRQSLHFRQEQEDLKGVAQASNVIGLLHDARGDRDSAMIYYLRALEINEGIRYQKGIATTLNNIAVSYYSAKQYQDAIQYLRKAAAIDVAQGMEEDASYSYSNIGSCFSKITEYDSALVYHQKALAIRKRLNLKLEMARSLNNLGAAYRALGNREEAAKNMLASLAIKRTSSNGYEEATTLNNLGTLYNEMGRYSQALVYLEQALAIADTLQAPTTREISYGALAAAHAGLNDYQRAFRFLTMQQQLHDSIVMDDKERRLQSLQLKFNEAQSQAENDRLKAVVAEEKASRASAELEEARLKKQNYLLYGIIIVVLTLGISALILLILNRRRRQQLQQLYAALELRSQEIQEKKEEISRQAQQLQLQNEQISQMNQHLESLVDTRTRSLLKANQELDTFLYQSSHSLRGPLMRMKGLHHLLQVETNAQLQQTLRQKLEFTISMMDGMLHKLMSVPEISRRELESEPVQPRHLVYELVSQIETANHAPPSKLEMDIPDGYLEVPSRYLFELLLRCLLENAVFYRKADRRQSHLVRVSMTVTDGQLIMRIRDNGLGVPEEVLPTVFDMFVRGTHASAGTGLGLFVARKVVDKFGGSISIQSQTGSYTEVEVGFPARLLLPTHLEALDSEKAFSK